MRLHVIRPGETLTAIAKAYGLAGWQSLYFSDANAQFRQMCRDPDRVQPGTTLVIPTDPATVRRKLEMQMARLMQARAELPAMQRSIEGELRSALAKTQSMGANVDMAATVLLIFVALGKSVHLAHKTLGLEGAALVQANLAVAKEATGIGSGQIRDVLVRQLADMKVASDNQIWLVAKSVASAFCDATSPSFWANTYVQLRDGQSWSQAVTMRPEDVLAHSVADLHRATQKASDDLDRKIAEVRREIAAL